MYKPPFDVNYCFVVAYNMGYWMSKNGSLAIVNPFLNIPHTTDEVFHRSLFEYWEKGFSDYKGGENEY